MSCVGDGEQVQYITQGRHSLTSTEMILKWFSGSCLMSHDVYHPTVMIQTLLWLVVKWSDVSVVQSNHVWYMNLQYEMVVAGRSGSSHMLSEKDYPLVFLSAITNGLPSLVMLSKSIQVKESWEQGSLCKC